MIDKVISRASISLRRLKGGKGQTFIEYILVLSFISVLCVGCVSIFGHELQGIYQSINNSLAVAFASVR